MLIYLLRHGLSDHHKDLAEETWQLTESGKDRTKLAGLGLAKLLVKPDAILSSPHRRCMDSAAIVANELGIPSINIGKSESLLPNASPTALLEQLKKIDLKRILCVGHCPHLDQFISLVCKSNASMPMCSLTYAGAASLEVDLEEPEGYVNWMLTAEILSRLS